MNLNDVIHALGLKRHPEGGFYYETHRIPSPDGQRS
jgi:predicted cupin superfamily sugar epimerase